ncbi:MAG: hypothetical protein M0P01_08935 [Treponema sp.]|nr:hypothetical protein [Treponema sp.]
MSYELDFIGVNEQTKDSDAIAIRWKNTSGSDAPYTIGIYDGGIERYGDELKNHLNKYYFDDEDEEKNPSEKIINFVICSHSDQDHTAGLKTILENFKVQVLYMNRPWKYVDELIDNADDGRMTADSLKERLKSKYQYIANLEKLAEDKSIPIKEIFQGTEIEDRIIVLSPTKTSYKELIIESDKTPLTEEYSVDSLFSNVKNRFKEAIRKTIEWINDNWSTEFLHDDVTTSSENEQSVVVLGHMDGETENQKEFFLLTGDSGPKDLQEAVDFAKLIGRSLKNFVKIYQIPHHGGRHNLTPYIMNELVGPILQKDEMTDKQAFVSVGKNSDHPKKIVTNSFIKRGVKVYQTTGATLCHHYGIMPDRGWGTAERIQYSSQIENWDD